MPTNRKRSTDASQQLRPQPLTPEAVQEAEQAAQPPHSEAAVAYREQLQQAHATITEYLLATTQDRRSYNARRRQASSAIRKARALLRNKSAAKPSDQLLSQLCRNAAAEMIDDVFTRANITSLCPHLRGALRFSGRDMDSRAGQALDWGDPLAPDQLVRNRKLQLARSMGEELVELVLERIALAIDDAAIDNRAEPGRRPNVERDYLIRQIAEWWIEYRGPVTTAENSGFLVAVDAAFAAFGWPERGLQERVRAVLTG